jgi:hypothetical protein
MSVSPVARRTLGVLLVTTLVLLFTASAASALPLGLNWTGDYSQSESASEWDVIQHSGATVFRQQLSWGYKNEHGWGPYDKVFGLAAERGITVLPYLVGRANGSGQYPVEAEYGAWENWVYEVINRYGYGGDFWAGKPYAKPVNAWEVWNEPNLPEYSPEGKVQPVLYGQFLKRTASAIREAQQTRQPGHVGTEVLFGGLYMPAKNAVSFFSEATKEAGVAASFDGLAIHPYGFTSSHMGAFETEMNGARSALNAVTGGSGKSLWVTELGWPVEYNAPDGTPPVSETEQATLLTESFNWIKSHSSSMNIKSAFWYNYHDIGVANWAYHCGLRKGDGSFRPSWWSFQTEAQASTWPTVPTVQTSDATEIKEYEARLNGTVNPNGLQTSYHFEYGPDTGYGNSAPVPDGSIGAEGSATAVNSLISNLHAGVTYHYRLVASNASGTSYGADRQFSTLQPRPSAVVDAVGVTHIFYRGQNDQLNEYYQYGSLWKHRLWGYSGVMGGKPSAFLGSDGKIWVYFRGSNGQLRSWWFKGSEWNEENWGYAGTMAGDPSAFEGSDGKRWVYFKATNGGLREWWFKGSEWHEEQRGNANAMGGDPVAFQGTEGTRWVYFRGPSGELKSWWFKGSEWNEGISGYSNSLAGDPAAITTPAGKREVFYFDSLAFPFHWWFQNSEWNLEPLIY